MNSIFDFNFFNFAHYFNFNFYGCSVIATPRSRGDITSQIACEKLKQIPFAPEKVKMRLSKLIEEVNLYPTDGKIKQTLFQLSTNHLYSSLVLPSKVNIVVMGMVHDDGFGDYYHILNAAEQIKSKFQGIKVFMLVSYEEDNLSTKVRKPIDANIEVIFRNFEQECKHFYRVMEEADQIIEMSQRTHRNQTISDILRQKGDKYNFIGEYGYGDRPQVMGLKSDQWGIIIKDRPLTTSLQDLKNEKLKQVLFGKINPSNEDLENYLQTHEPFIGYLKMGSYYQMGLIYTAAAYLKLSGKETIDLMIPPVKLEYLDVDFLKEQGIGKIKVIKFEKGQMTENEVILAEKGKEIRFINPFPLDQSDFHILLAHTNPLVGCTGDHSLSEVISFDRLPFYELRYMKVSFINDLIELAGQVGKKTQYLKQYYQELNDIYDQAHERVINAFKMDELPNLDKKFYEDKLEYFKMKQPKIAASSLKIANLLHQPGIFEECHELNELLRSQYSFNETLLNIVERQFALNNHHDLKKIENALEEQYLDGQITIYQASEQLAEKIKAITG